MKPHFASLGVLVLGSVVLAAPLSAQADPVYDAADNIWYEAVYAGAGGTTWNEAAAQATALGGFLATPMNDSQNNFVYSLVTDPEYWTGLSVNSDRLGPWLGIYSTTSSGENFVYSETALPLGSFQPWGPNQPDDYGGGYQAVGFYAYASEGPTWGDTPEDGVNGFPLPTGFVVQFSADPLAAPNSVAEPNSVAMVLSSLVSMGVIARGRRSWRRKWGLASRSS